MKVGVYNLYWSTFGGGEQLASAAVDALTADHDVELLGPDAVDLDEVRERLGVRLDGVTFRRVASDGYAGTLVSADYDLFVNHTYRSTAPSLARHGLYVVMFPHELTPRRSRQLAQRAGRSFANDTRVLGGIGWRRGEAVVDGPVVLQVPAGARAVRAVLRTDRAEEISVVQIGVGEVPTVHQVALTADVTVVLNNGDEHLGQIVLSPATLADQRHVEQHLVLEAAYVDGRPIDVSPRAVRNRLVPPRSAEFLRTYQRVVAISEYTRRWALRWWGRGEEIVSPPVRMREGGPKEQLILSLGRFFGEESGHSKRQLDLVRTFRSMVEQGLEGWRLVLIGGCSPKDRDYAMAVRREAEGLPVEVRLSAPGAVVDAHLAAASIYWHGAGYGSDLEQHPDRAEHFGIAPIEAMSAGAVPVVFDAGGPAEVVRHGIDGMRFATLDDLASQTRRLISDPSLRQRLATAGQARAHEFDVEHCEARFREVVAGMIAGSDTR